ncbi:MAG: hypothetical protein P1V97_00015 [Planctomycetota bacterium]|nr:hypothetical protein [Planctomycetota bacterium]
MTTNLKRNLLFSAVTTMGCALALSGPVYAQEQSNGNHDGNNGNGVGNILLGNQGNDGANGAAGGTRNHKETVKKNSTGCTSRGTVTYKEPTTKGFTCKKASIDQYKEIKANNPGCEVISTDGGSDDPDFANMETSFVGAIFAPNTTCTVTYVPAREVEDGVTIPTEDDLDTCENVYFKRVKCYYVTLNKEKCFKFKRRTDAEVNEEASECQGRIEKAQKDEKDAREALEDAEEDVNKKTREYESCKKDRDEADTKQRACLRDKDDSKRKLDSCVRDNKSSQSKRKSCGDKYNSDKSKYDNERKKYDDLRVSCSNKFEKVESARKTAENRQKTLIEKQAKSREVIAECEAVFEEKRKRDSGLDTLDDVDFDEVSKALDVLTGYVEQEFRLLQKDRSEGKCNGWSNTSFSSMSFRKDGQLCVSVYSGLYTKSEAGEGDVSVAKYQKDAETKSCGDGDPLKSNSSLKRNSETDSFRDNACERIQYDWKQRCRSYANFNRLVPQAETASTRYVEVQESSERVYDTRCIPSTNEEANKDTLANLCSSYEGKSLSAAQKRIEEVKNQGFGKDIVNVRIPDFFVRLGDEDAFGFRNIGNYYASFGGACDTDGNGLLGPGEFMPNLNGGEGIKSSCATGAKDDFCNRDNAELTDTANYSNGCVVHVGTTGSKYTDVALSTSWTSSLNKSKTKGFYYNHPGKDHDGRMHTIAGRTYEEIAAAGFPDGGSSRNLPNMPGLVVDCKISPATLAKLRRNNSNKFGSIFVNILAADWDVPPFKLVITNANGDSYTYPITRQSNAKGEDGMVQAGFVTLSMDDFCDASGNFFLQANFEAPKEPYVTIDYLEVSTRVISVEPDQNELYVTGDIQVGPDGESKYDITDHSGAKLRAESLRFVPEPKLDTSKTPSPRTFGPGTTTILTSETYDNFVLSAGSTVIIKGNVTLNVLGKMEVPLGSRLIMEDISPGRASKAEIFVGGDVNITGMFENTVAKNFRIVSIQDAANGGAGVNITISKDFIGAIAAKDVRITTENGAKISFTYDKAAALQGIEGSKERLVVKALLDDRLGN